MTNDYPDDVIRIVAAMKAEGFNVLADDMDNLWSYASTTMDAGWLALPSDDRDIVRTILGAAFRRNYAC